MTFIVKGKFVLRPKAPMDLVQSDEISDAMIATLRAVDEKAAAELEQTRVELGQGSATGETMREDDEGRVGEVIYPGDFVDYKPSAEVMLRGSCYAPGRDTNECEVTFGVGSWEKKLKVVGHRVWVDRAGGGKHTKPKPIGRMLLDYAHAYGGPGFLNNPVGKGHRHELSEAEREDLYQPPRSERSAVMPLDQLPNVMHANGSEQKKGLAAGFGPINSAWPYRAVKLGKKYDQKWLETRAPYFSEDMDFGYFQSAPPDQVLDGFLRGDEELRFQNMHPKSSDWTAQLPGVRVRVFVRDIEEHNREIVMHLDTLFADLDAGEIHLTWRGTTPVKEEDLSDMAFAVIATEDLQEKRLPAAKYVADLEAFAADPVGLKEAMPDGFMEFAEGAEKLEDASDEELEKLLENADGNSPPVAMFKNIFGPMAPAGLEKMDGTWAKAAEQEQVDEANMKQQVLTGLKSALRGGGGGMDAEVETDTASGAVKAGSGARGTGPVITPAVGMRLPVREGEDVVFPIGNMIREQEKRLLKLKKSEQFSELSPEQLAGVHQKLDKAIDKLRTNPELVANDKHYRPYSEGDAPPDEPGPGADLQGHDLSDWDLSGADLSGADLQCAILSRTNLSGANLTGAKLGGARLNRADLSGANFSNVDLTSASFDRVLAKATNFSGVRLDMFRAEKSNFSEASFAKAEGQLGSFNGCSLLGTRFHGASFLMQTFDSCSVEETGFQSANLEHVRFDKCTGKGLVLERSELNGTSFNECKLPALQASKARGKGAVWFDTVMDQATFFRADLVDAHFFLVTAREASFVEANLPGARFDRAVLREANFEKANLKSADFRKAVLTKVRFRGASLFEAQLTEAAGVDLDFRNANEKGLNVQRSRLTRR
jgi:uncharacterized protein YjbI with pentapeptide repeats